MKCFHVFFICMVWIMLCQSCNDHSEGRRYGIRKGILVSESIYSGNRAKSTVTLHFDNYGKQEYTIAKAETGVNGVLQIREQHSLLLGDFLYSWDPATNKGSKYKYADVLDPFKLSKEDFTEDLKKQFNYKEHGTEEFMGKTCDVISLSFDGIEGRMYSWKNIILKSEVSSQGVQVTTQAISLDESPSLDKKMFELPEGSIEFSEFSIPARPN